MNVAAVEYAYKEDCVFFADNMFDSIQVVAGWVVVGLVGGGWVGGWWLGGWWLGGWVVAGEVAG